MVNRAGVTLAEFCCDKREESSRNQNSSTDAGKDRIRENESSSHAASGLTKGAGIVDPESKHLLALNQELQSLIAEDCCGDD